MVEKTNSSHYGRNLRLKLLTIVFVIEMTIAGILIYLADNNLISYSQFSSTVPLILLAVFFASIVIASYGRKKELSKTN